MKPDYKEPYEDFNIGDEVEYKDQRMTIIDCHVLSNGLIQFDLEADTCIHRNIPNWCCSIPKYTKNEIVPSFCSRLKSLFK